MHLNYLDKATLFKTLFTLCLTLCFVQNAMADFDGDVVSIWLHDKNGPDREMKLTKDFKYTDPSGHTWVVPAGATIDGASIPRILWSTIGSPFVGDYRRASVVHDYYCKKEKMPWKDTHRMFYQASKKDGVSDIIALIMYKAIYAQGPRWPAPGVLGASVQAKPDITDEQLINMDPWIRSEKPSLNEIENRIRDISRQNLHRQ